MSEIASAQALRALLQSEATAIAVACRALGLTPASFRAVLALRAKRLGQPETRIEQDLAAYEALPAGTSQRAMRFLKFRTSPH